VIHVQLHIVLIPKVKEDGTTWAPPLLVREVALLERRGLTTHRRRPIEVVYQLIYVTDSAIGSARASFQCATYTARKGLGEATHSED
jgi:hypothetical protein